MKSLKQTQPMTAHETEQPTPRAIPKTSDYEPWFVDQDGFARPMFVDHLPERPW